MTKNAKKICNLNFHSTIGGTQHTLCSVLIILKRFYDVKVVDPYGNADFAALTTEIGMDIENAVIVGGNTFLSTRKGAARILDYIRALPRYLCAALLFRNWVVREQIDVMYVNQTKAAVFAAIACPLSVPIVFHCHDPYAIGIRLVALLGNRIKMTIANSPFTAEQLVKAGFLNDRITTVTNAVSIRELNEKSLQVSDDPLPNPQQPPVLLLAHAGIEPNKGTILATRALGKLAQAGLPGELWITGTVSSVNQGYLDEVYKSVSDLGIADRVHFLGRRSDIYSVMKKADIILVPTVLSESFGRVAVEAMALGKPVVVSNRGALPALVQDGQTGRIFSVERDGTLADVLTELVSNPELRERFGRNGAELAQRFFGIEEFERRILKVFSALLHTG